MGGREELRAVLNDGSLAALEVDRGALLGHDDHGLLIRRREGGRARSVEEGKNQGNVSNGTRKRGGEKKDAQCSRYRGKDPGVSSCSHERAWQ
jgi:hypothetical protein